MKTSLLRNLQPATATGCHRCRWPALRACALLIATLLVPLASNVRAAAYVFTNIADSTGIFAPTEPMSGIGNGFLSINSSGTVAFGSGLDDGSFGVFKGNGGAITPIALTSGPMFSGVSGGSINDAGTVAFSASLDAGGSGIFTGNGGTTTTIVTTSEGFTGFGGAPRISDAGRVLFGGNQGGGGGGLFLRGGGQPSATVAVQNGPTFGSISGAAINSPGTAAFSAALRSGAQGVFTGSGGPVTTIGLENFPGGVDPSISDSGTVAFSADPIGPSFSVASRILIGNGGPIMTYVSNAGPFNAFGKYPVINNSGTVAFLGGLDVLTTVGIFTGPDPIADKVILNNEPLFGSTVVNFSPGDIENRGAMDINDSGQIAFHYELADGRQGIAVATPVPEPSVVALFLAATAVIGCRRVLRFVLITLRSNVCVLARPVAARATMMGCFACTCHAVPYSFTIVADTNGIFAPSGGPGPGVGIGSGFLSINNFGTVAFNSTLDDGSNGVFKGNGGAVTSIALSSGPQFSLVGGASINSSGTVAFLGQLEAGGSGIFTGNGGALTTIVTTSEGFTGFGLPLMNDAGRVALGAGLGGSSGLILRGAGPAATVALESGPIFSGLVGFSINSLGAVAFSAVLDSGSAGVFTGNGGPVATIAFADFPARMSPSINDVGTVAFSADPIGADLSVAARILIGNGGPIGTYVSNAGPFSAFGIYPIINDSGIVAFLGGLDSSGQAGIFTGPDPSADKVILTGESLFGSVLTSLVPTNIEHAGIIDLNDSGQIAFHYQLADGRQGIAVGTPVPEPQTAVGLVVGAVALCVRRWPRVWRIAKSNQERI